MRTASRGREQLVAARTGTRRFFRSIAWALTLALALGGLLGDGLLRFAPLTYPLSIATTLLAAALAADPGLPPSLAGTPMPPPICRLLACRTAVPRLGILGLKELLAAFQQTAATTRPSTRALLGRRSSIMMKLTQGSANSPKVKSRRGSLLPSGTPCIRCLIPRPPSVPG